MYDDSAIILNYILNYKLLDGKRVGFPDNAINKVTDKLEELKLSYTINITEHEPVIKDFKKNNAYEKFLAEAKSKLSAKNKIEILEQKIKNANQSDIDNIVRLIDDYFTNN